MDPSGRPGNQPANAATTAVLSSRTSGLRLSFLTLGPDSVPVCRMQKLGPLPCPTAPLPLCSRGLPPSLHRFLPRSSVTCLENLALPSPPNMHVGEQSPCISLAHPTVPLGTFPGLSPGPGTKPGFRKHWLN